jgi:cell division control protein 6
MIVRREIFDEDHRPQRLLHRESETQLLLEALDPGDDGARRGHAVLSGPSGVGKTVLSKQCCERLRERRGTIDAHVRCLGAEPGTIYRRAIGGFQMGLDDVDQNEAVADVIALLQEVAADATPGAVVVLDEADDIKTEAVETLSSLRGLSVVVICHNPNDWFNRLPPDVRDRFKAGTEIALDRYGGAELGDILERRAEAGLRAGTWNRDQLEFIADHQAGVARDAIQSLRAAAEVAGERGHDTIHESDIERGFERAKRDIREGNIKSLPVTHLLLYEIVRQASEIGATDLHSVYDRVAEEALYNTPKQSVGKRARRNQIQKLVDYDLVDYKGENQDRVYWPTERELTSPVDFGVDLVVPQP